MNKTGLVQEEQPIEKTDKVIVKIKFENKYR